MSNTAVTFRQYARRTGVSVSTVSRGVARGKIPVVLVDGERRIDPLAADAARERQRHARGYGPGGSPETRAANATAFKAKAGCGYDFGQQKLLAALHAHGPRLIAEGMRHAGVEDEVAIAKAAAVMKDIASTLACSVFDEFNNRGIVDYRQVLPETINPRLSPDAFAVYSAWAEDCSDLWPDAWYDLVFDICGRAKV